MKFPSPVRQQSLGGMERLKSISSNRNHHSQLPVAAVYSLSLLLLTILSCWPQFGEAASISWFLSHAQLAAAAGLHSPPPPPHLAESSSGNFKPDCDVITTFSRKQRKLCQTHPEIMSLVQEGIQVGITECQNQFGDERWNCSISTKTGELLLKLENREAAYLYAISSAGVVHHLARGCAAGNLHACGCGRTQRGIGFDRNGTNFQWGGCGDNVKFAAKFARKFLDNRSAATASKSSAKKKKHALMQLHNNRAGRKSVKRLMGLQCKCHGVSGSCTTRTCWEATSEFSAVGARLRKKYKRALQVAVSTSKGDTLVPLNHHNYNNPHFVYSDAPMPIRPETEDGTTIIGMKVAAKDRLLLATRKTSGIKNMYKKKVPGSDLVFFDPSPDYCVFDVKAGSLGTEGRKCQKDSSGPDSCDLLCCGRGFKTKTVLKKTQCQCKFVWCCKVVCKTCASWVDEYTCKGGAGYSSPIMTTDLLNRFSEQSRLRLEQLSSAESKSLPSIPSSGMRSGPGISVSSKLI